LRENFQLARERLAVVTVIVGEAVGSILSLVFYFSFLVPFALISIFSTDPLHRRVSGNAFWLERDPVSSELDRAQRQG
jgi:hypothetical protein